MHLIKAHNAMLILFKCLESFEILPLSIPKLLQHGQLNVKRFTITRSIRCFAKTW